MSKFIYKLKLIKYMLKGDEEMFVKSWVICITYGSSNFTYDDVPKFLKKQVAEALIEIGLGNLVTDKNVSK